MHCKKFIRTDDFQRSRTSNPLTNAQLRCEKILVKQYFVPLDFSTQLISMMLVYCSICLFVCQSGYRPHCLLICFSVCLCLSHTSICLSLFLFLFFSFFFPLFLSISSPLTFTLSLFRPDVGLSICMSMSFSPLIN